jgi:hypothetical protein
VLSLNLGGSKQADRKISVIGCGEQWHKSR